jgi:hypothetical protein
MEGELMEADMRHLVGRARMAIATALVTIALAGCGGNQADTGIIPNQPTILRVDNQSFNDMRIYVIQGGQRIRVGTANGKNISTVQAVEERHHRLHHGQGRGGADRWQRAFGQ